jgi:release factor glutamine methyltransferase
MVEHGYDQADAVRALFAGARFEAIESRRDLAGIPRVVLGRLGSERLGSEL